MCYRASCCRRISLFASLLASARTNSDRLVNIEWHDTQEDGARTVGLHPMLCVQLQSRFAVFNTVTGPTRSMGRVPRPLANERDWSSHSCRVVVVLVLVLVLVLNSSSRFARRIHDTELLFSRALFSNQHHADNVLLLSTKALSDRSNPLASYRDEGREQWRRCRALQRYSSQGQGQGPGVVTEGLL
jgi:hypothetical protein